MLQTWTSSLPCCLVFFLCFCCSYSLAQRDVEACVDAWEGISYELPSPFRDMLQFQHPEKRLYIAIDEPGASNSNNGLFPTYQGGNNGPLKDFSGLEELEQGFGTTVNPGDQIFVRGGIYAIDTSLTIALEGSPNKPIHIKAYPGERPIIEGSYNEEYVQSLFNKPNQLQAYADTWYFTPLVRLSGKYFILDGFTIQKPHFTGVLWKGQHIIVQNCTFIGSIEELIKTTETTRYGLNLNNDFSQFVGEGVDIFGAHHFYTVGCSFHDNKGGFPQGWGTAMWSKAGADSIFQVNNHFFNMTVKNHALNLGGCCWNNWTEPIDPVSQLPKPVSTYVFAWGNLFENIRLDPALDFRYKGVLTFEGTFYSEAKNNVFFNCEDAISIRATRDGPYFLTAAHITISNNVISHPTGGRLFNIIDTYNPSNVRIDSNEVYTDGSWSCAVGKVQSTYSTFRVNYGFDTMGKQRDFASTCDALQQLVSVDKNFTSSLDVFPNPSHQYIWLTNTSNLPITKLIVYSHQGKRIFEGRPQQPLDVSSFPPGFYFLTVEVGGETVHKRIVVQ